MIAFAISCLLVAVVVAAVLSATDSVMRGWHSYRMLTAELRALRHDMNGPAETTALSKIRPSAMPGSRRPSRQHRMASTAFLAAA